MKAYTRIYEIFTGEGALGIEDLKKVFLSKLETFAPDKFLEELELQHQSQKEILEDFEQKIIRDLERN